MKSKILLILALLAMAASGVATTAAADGAGGDVIGHTKKFGIGVGGGTLTYGISPKFYLSTTDAIQATLGTSMYGLDVGVDYVHEMGTWVDVAPGRLWWDLGAGAEALLYDYLGHNSTVLGVAGIFEVGWHFKKFPVELTASVRPTFYIGNYWEGFHFGGGGAARWYF
ncbi:MAG: hypothetical protein HY902_17910 [Deltaproteobacteria bacterium]|nr:hypothetical protein [Deltaproteobacteria bacterium]